jgi:hypothetical protein
MKIGKVPGVGSYEMKDEKLTSLGKINERCLLPIREKFETPAPGTYSPKHGYTEKKGQDAIIQLTSNRTDFSSSPTKKLGPGAYEIIKKFEQELGVLCSRTERLREKPVESVSDA